MYRPISCTTSKRVLQDTRIMIMSTLLHGFQPWDCSRRPPLGRTGHLPLDIARDSLLPDLLFVPITKFVKTPMCSLKVTVKMRHRATCDMKQHCVYVKRKPHDIASIVVLTIFSTEEKYVSQRNCVCCRINSITSPPTDCTKCGTCTCSNQLFITFSHSPIMPASV